MHWLSVRSQVLELSHRGQELSSTQKEGIEVDPKDMRKMGKCERLVGAIVPLGVSRSSWLRKTKAFPPKSNNWRRHSQNPALILHCPEVADLKLNSGL